MPKPFEQFKQLWSQLRGKVKVPELTSPSLANIRQNIAGKLEKTNLTDIQNFLRTTIGKPRNSVYGIALTIILTSWFVADLTALLAEKFIPEPPIARPRGGSAWNTQRGKMVEDYNIIVTRNLFNSQGRLPGEESPSGQDPGGTPVRTTLPFNLIGTLVLSDEFKSIATIEDKSAQAVYPVRIKDEIPGKARIIKVEARKVIFFNPGSGRREFIDLPDDGLQNIRLGGVGVTVSKPKGGAGIEQLSATQYQISRSEVDKTLSDINNVLTQARAVPNFENGMPAGYKLFQIVPGSIYDKLGLKDGDTLCGLNGESINDPGKAFELLGQLKSTNHLELCVKREGKQSTYAYDIN